MNECASLALLSARTTTSATFFDNIVSSAVCDMRSSARVIEPTRRYDFFILSCTLRYAHTYVK